MMWGCALASDLRRELATPGVMKTPLPYIVYVPDGYEGGQSRYPVLYLLHGAGSGATEWTDVIQIKTIIDDMVAQRTIPPALIVMPECRACWWVDSPQAAMETAFWSDLVPTITRRYRTIDTREGRAIAGFSAGGYGAVRFGLQYPERFAALAAISPAVYADVPPAQSAARVQFPFRNPNGEFNAALWKSRNYPALMEAYRRQGVLVSMYVVAGDHDKLGIAFETALLFKTLFEVQPEQVEFRVVDGGHSPQMVARALPDALKYLFSKLQPPIAVTGTPAKPAAVAVAK